jgi:hypothetical protein
MTSAAVILGAGFSYVAGLPLARDLLTCPVIVPSDQAAREWATLSSVFRRWQHENPEHGPEQFLAHLKDAVGSWDGVLWPAAVRRVAAALGLTAADVIPGRERYSNMVTRPYRCESHRLFWDFVLTSFRVTGVVTTNYDLLAERGLRHQPTVRPPIRPGCHYGGFPRPQYLHGSPQPFRAGMSQEPTVLRHGVPVYKIHGSLNWAHAAGGGLTMYSDSRPAFRLSSDCAIVPPVPEKTMPGWLADVWAGAETCLGASADWVVCGFSLPPYDGAVYELFHRAAVGAPKRIFLLDPSSAQIAHRYQAVAPSATVIPLAGLPQGIGQIEAITT